MATAENRRRKRSRKEEEVRSFWSFFSREQHEENDFTRSTFFARHGEEDEPEDGEDESRSILRELWSRFNFWSLVATLLFLAFTGGLIFVVVRMWQPQDLKDIAGYTDKGASRDLSLLIRNANGAPVSFTEGELNRYLRDTCRMRQTGIFSIIAHAQGVAVRVHNGYAELVIDRLVGSNMHQTTAVNLSFHQKNEHGRPVLKIDFQGGAPLLGRMPRGGRIGRVGVPQRHIQVLKPALETLLTCYPDIVAAMEEHGYCPHFEQGANQQEGRITLVPYSPQ